jgi:hypothetical protein
VGGSVDDRLLKVSRFSKTFLKLCISSRRSCKGNPSFRPASSRVLLLHDRCLGTAGYP